MYILILLILTLLIRFFAASFGVIHPIDMGTFAAWSEILAQGGFSGFYGGDFFSDYPVGYMYILALLGHFAEFLGLAPGSIPHNILLKTPAILADGGAVVFLYIIAKKFDSGKFFLGIPMPFLIALAYAFNPLIILTSSIWGQVDSIHTLLMLISVYLISRQKILISVILLTLSILIKPQSFMFAPIFLFFFWRFIFGESRPKFNRKNFLILVKYGILCIAIIIALILPFVDFSALPALPVLNQYVTTLGSYPFITVNAYNIFSFIGLNWVPLTPFFTALGIFALILTSLFAIYLLHQDQSPQNSLFVGAILVLCTFNLSIMMHERYNFPALAFLLASFAISGDRRIFRLFWMLTAAFLLNYIDILHNAIIGFPRDSILYTERIFAIPMVGLFVYTIYLALDSPKINLPIISEKIKSILVITIITIAYATLAFTNLGNRHAPENPLRATHGDQILADFGEITPLRWIQFKTGAIDGHFAIDFSFDGENWTPPIFIHADSVFAWDYLDFHEGSGYVRFIRITVLTDLHILEIAFRAPNFDKILPITASPLAAPLFDEQHLVPDILICHTHSAIFDEVFHARTAYEFIHGLPPFEWTHPPLGKTLISLGVRAFGMTPFGWRFAGTISGILMLPLIFALAKAIFRSTKWGALSAILFATSFMLFAQTRLATIDSFLVFFTMAMFYAMYHYTQTDFENTPFPKTLIPLAFAGIFAGLAISVKWQTAYAVIGVAIVFFTTTIPQRKLFVKTCLACVGFFIAIPLIIYILAYIPFYRTGGFHNLGFFGEIVQNQIDMFVFHSQTVIGATHPFSSNPLQWIFNTRPILYSTTTLPNGLISSIAAFGNPALVWLGIPAIIFTIHHYIKTRDKSALFLLIAYFSQLLPWLLVPRLTFIYHYFPSIPILALLLIYTIKYAPLPSSAIKIFTAINLFLFILFFPILAGIPASRDFIDFWLSWLPGWIFAI